MKRLLLLLLVLLAAPAAAQNLPALTGRIVDQADLLPPDREAALSAKLEQLERDTSRQLVVVTVPGLQAYPSIEDLGFALGEKWKIGDKEADNGAILLVAPNDRKMRIEVGDGLEPILPDAMAHIIIRDTITPRFKAGDMAGGIEAGTDAIIAQLRAPPEVAEAKAIEAQRNQAQARDRSRSSSGASFVPMIFWGMVILFVMLSGLRGGRRRGRRGAWGGRRYGGSDLPILLWALGSALDSGRGSSGWGGGGGFGGGGGGFSGGGGSFGGGGASGSW